MYVAIWKITEWSERHPNATAIICNVVAGVLAVVSIGFVVASFVLHLPVLCLIGITTLFFVPKIAP